jgi:hypothetical protein
MYYIFAEVVLIFFFYPKFHFHIKVWQMSITSYSCILNVLCPILPIHVTDIYKRCNIPCSWLYACTWNNSYTPDVIFDFKDHSGVAQSVWWLGYRLDDRGSIPGKGKERKSFSSLPRPDRPWGPLSLLSNRYRGVRLTTHLPPTSSWRSAYSYVNVMSIMHIYTLIVPYSSGWHMWDVVRSTKTLWSRRWSR